MATIFFTLRILTPSHENRPSSEHPWSLKTGVNTPGLHIWRILRAVRLQVANQKEQHTILTWKISWSLISSQWFPTKMIGKIKQHLFFPRNDAVFADVPKLLQPPQTKSRKPIIGRPKKKPCESQLHYDACSNQKRGCFLLMLVSLGILAHLVRGWLGYPITETKRKVFRFHETILRRWARIPRV